MLLAVRRLIVLSILLLPSLQPCGASADMPAPSPGAVVGPSFTCGRGQEPLARLICGDLGFSRLDLQFAQAYEALRQQSAPADRHALWQEQLSFHTSVLERCSIQVGGDEPPAPDSLVCAKQAYEKQRQQWLSRLSGVALEEANRPPEDHIAAQRALQSKGYLPADALIDGVYGPATRTGIVAFQQSNHVPTSGLLGDDDFRLLAAAAETHEADSKTDPVDIDAIREVPPIASATYAGKPIQLVHGDLTVTLAGEPSTDAKLCGESSPSGCHIVVARVEEGSQQLLAMPGEEVEDNEISLAAAKIELRSLDAASSEPAIVFSVYTGGAHCCYLTKIEVRGVDGAWTVVDAGELDGEPFQFVDLLRNSETELVHKDDRFDYAFGCYACSSAAMRVRRLDGANLLDVSAAPAFHDYQVAALRRMEQLPASTMDIQPQAYLAGWVAQKSVVGQLADAWSKMLARSDRSESEGLEVCGSDVPIAQCPSSLKSNVDFPSALALFLVRAGYMTQLESAQLGYDPAGIEAHIQAQATSWYFYLRSGECAPATTWASPADLISSDREDGIADDFEVVKADSDGKPIMVRVRKPEPGDMVSVYTFFRGVEACNDYRRQQEQELQNLR